MATLFHVSGAYIYVDVDGNTVGVEDVFSKIDKAREHYRNVGLAPTEWISSSAEVTGLTPPGVARAARHRHRGRLSPYGILFIPSSPIRVKEAGLSMKSL